MPRTTSILLSTVTALAGLAVVSLPAAAKTSAPPAQCEIGTPKVAQPFAAFGDPRNYVLAPGGAFESSTEDGWALSRGAAIVEGNEPFQVGDPADSMSLSLPGGSVAVSPPMCIDATYDVMRLFVRALGSGRAGKLRVTAIYPDLRKSDPLRASIGGSGTDWELTDDIEIRPNGDGDGDDGKDASFSGTTRVSFRFESKGSAKTGHQIDDVYVDPRSSR